jgi:CelD/BcsL family acetyltransferase involved in cellulose biosynthesis
MAADMPDRLTWTHHSAKELTSNATLRDDWNQLNATTTRQVFMDAEAIGCALKHFGTGKERLFVGTAQGQVVCMAVLSRIDALRWSTFQPSQIPLGAFLIAPHVGLDTASAALLRALPATALLLSITQLDSLYVPRPADTATLRLDDYIETGWIELTGTFEEYWAGRGKNLRQNMRKQLNKLAAEGTAVEFRTISEASDMAAAVARYGEVESAGWKAESGTAIHPDNEQGRFYAELLTIEAAHGSALVHEYWLDGGLAASNLCLVHDKTLVVLKTTYDEKYTQLSPAFLLRLAQTQSAYETGDVDRIEFYGRKRDWHTRWTEKFRTVYHASAYRGSLIRKITESRRQAPT